MCIAYDTFEEGEVCDVDASTLLELAMVSHIAVTYSEPPLVSVLFQLQPAIIMADTTLGVTLQVKHVVPFASSKNLSRK